MKADRVRTAGQVLSRLLKVGAIPADAEVRPRAGEAWWSEPELNFCLSVQRDRFPSELINFDVRLIVSMPGQLGLSIAAGGLAASVVICGAEPPNFVPTADIEEFVRGARSFVSGPRDLCWLLSRERDVWRDGRYVATYQGYPARLTKALFIARQRGYDDLAEDVVSVLTSGQRHETSPVDTEDILEAARRCAREYEKSTGLPLVRSLAEL